MTCGKCGKYFCWSVFVCVVYVDDDCRLCLKKLSGDPYAHFRDGGSCSGRLFDGLMDVEVDNQDWAGDDDDDDDEDVLDFNLFD